MTKFFHCRCMCFFDNKKLSMLSKIILLYTSIAKKCIKNYLCIIFAVYVKSYVYQKSHMPGKCASKDFKNVPDLEIFEFRKHRIEEKSNEVKK